MKNIEICVDDYVKMYLEGNKKAIEKNKYIIMLGLTYDQLKKFNEEYGDEIVNDYVNKFEELLSDKEMLKLMEDEELKKKELGITENKIHLRLTLDTNEVINIILKQTIPSNN